MNHRKMGWLVVLYLIAALVLPGTGYAASISVDKTSLDFGKMLVSDYGGNQSVVIAKIGDETIACCKLEISGQDYEIYEENCGWKGDFTNDCEVTINFKPSSVGEKVAALQITAEDSSGSPIVERVTIMGTAVPLSEAISVEPLSHDFGKVYAAPIDFGDTLRKTFTLANKTDYELRLELGGIEVEPDFWNREGDFYVESLEEDCDRGSNNNIRVESNCEVEVAFAPLDTGGKTDTLEIFASNGEIFEASLQGEGIAPDMRVDDHDFGEVELYTENWQALVISNEGNGPLEIYDIHLDSGNSFHIGEHSCQSIEPGESCEVMISFNPVEIGYVEDVLKIYSNDPDYLDYCHEGCGGMAVYLRGTGVGVFEVWASPNSYDFGPINAGETSPPETFTINNSGSAGGWVSSIEISGGDFEIANDFCSGSYLFAWEGSCQFEVFFKPQSKGNQEGSVSITGYDDSERYWYSEVPLFGEGGLTELTVTPTERDFGEASINKPSYQLFTISNPNQVALQVGTVNLTGGTAAEFQRIPFSTFQCLNKTLLPNQECYEYIMFKPTSVGEKQATLVIPANLGMTSLEVPLKAKAFTSISDDTACSLTPTIQTLKSGDWASPKVYSYSRVWKYWSYLPYDIDKIWGDLNGNPVNRLPGPNDIVRINPGHQVVADFIEPTVKALCNLGTLKRQNSDLNIKADQVSNHGIIKAASINLKGNSQSGTSFYNTGTLQAWNGRDKTTGGEKGGSIEIYLCQVINRGEIIAGNGGAGRVSSGTGGNGGQVIIQERGSSCREKMIESTGSVIGGNGGNGCGGGNGGKLIFNASRVSLGGKTPTPQHHAGKGGRPLASSCQAGLDGTIYIDPTVILTEGANLEGREIVLFGGDDWTLDLSNLTTPAVDATGNITLAVGKNGVVNFTGTQGLALKTTGDVKIYSDHLVLTEGTELSNVIQAANIVTGPSQILHDVTITGPTKITGLPETTISLPLTLINSGPTTDSYTLTVTDSQGWTLGQLATPITLEGLAITELALEVTLPTTVGAEDIITVTVISQADPTVLSHEEILVVVENPYVYQFYRNGELQTSDSKRWLKPGDLLTFDYEADLSGFSISQDQSEGIELENLQIEEGVVSATVKSVAETAPLNVYIRLLKEETEEIQRIYEEFEPLPISLTTATNPVSGEAETSVPITFTLANRGSTADTYRLEVTDQQSWPMTTPPSPVALADAQSGDWTFEVTLPSTPGATNTVTIKAHSETDTEVEATIEVTVMVLAHSLTGQVLDRQNQPIAEASVTVGNQTTTTDSEGRWQIEGLAAGNYTVVASHPYYLTQEQTVTVGKTTPEVTLKLRSLLRFTAVANPSPVCQGQAVDVTVKAISKPQPFDSLEFFLKFDATKLQANTLLPRSDLLELLLQSEIGSDYVHFAAGSLAENPPAGGEVATIHFTALAATNKATLLQFDPNFTNATLLGNYLPRTLYQETLVIESCGLCKVNLQGRASPPHNSWSTALRIYPQSDPLAVFSITTDHQGNCRLPAEVLTGSFCVKGAHTLAKQVAGPSTGSIVELGTLLEGDINDDNLVNLKDYSLWLMGKGKCAGDENYNPNADLNADGCIDLADAAFLKTPALGGNLYRPLLPPNDPLNAQVCQVPIPAGDLLEGTEVLEPLRTTPIPAGLQVGESFELAVQVSRPVDSAAAALNFDPQQLQVTAVTAGTALDLVLRSDFDNQTGQVSFAAGLQENTLPTGEFTLVTIQLTVLANGGERSLSFNMSEERPTEAVSEGRVVLLGGEVNIFEP